MGSGALGFRRGILGYGIGTVMFEKSESHQIGDVCGQLNMKIWMRYLC